MGSIQGGWEFVVAAYTVTAVVLGSYAVSVVLRWRAERNRARREATGAPEVAS